MGCICAESVWNIEANVILRYLLNDHEELKLMQRRIWICIKRGVGLLGSGSFFVFSFEEDFYHSVNGLWYNMIVCFTDIRKG